MVSVFNVEQLQEVLKDFHCITGIRITVFDHRFREVVSYPEERPEFCRLIRSCPAGSEGCDRCDREACRMASRRTSSYIYRCHAGLTEAITPLYAGGVLVGYLLFGHLFPYDSFQEGWETVRRCCESYPLDMEKLKEACGKCLRISDGYIKSAARILHATASYLALERMAGVQEDSDAARLDAYLSAGFHLPLSAEDICRELNLGRTRLYKLSRQLYGTGPAEHIRNLRMEQAKMLLETRPDCSIAEIGQRCGYSDYNYFIAVFSAQTGISPGMYRKQKQQEIRHS